LPGGLFGGETIHAFAGFAAAPSGDVALKLIARGDAKSLTASAVLPATVVEDRTLARVAAARRIETASEAEQLKLALHYGLLTSRTNLLVVHERAEGEKAKDLPELAKVAQMHAAGWHGVGSVHELHAPPVMARRIAPLACHSFDAPEPSAAVWKCYDRGDSIPGFLGDDEARADLESSKSLDRFLVAIERAGSGHLPATLEDLAGAGLPSALLDDLRAVVVAGYVEADVVRALYEALGGLVADGTVSAPVSRQFLRVLRRQFGRPDECRELRGKVKMATAAALAASVA
jgi:Ca-activated chloride channel family protein